MQNKVEAIRPKISTTPATANIAASPPKSLLEFVTRDGFRSNESESRREKLTRPRARQYQKNPSNQT